MERVDDEEPLLTERVELERLDVAGATLRTDCELLLLLTLRVPELLLTLRFDELLLPATLRLVELLLPATLRLFELLLPATLRLEEEAETLRFADEADTLRFADEADTVLSGDEVTDLDDTELAVLTVRSALDADRRAVVLRLRLRSQPPPPPCVGLKLSALE